LNEEDFSLIALPFFFWTWPYFMPRLSFRLIKILRQRGATAETPLPLPDTAVTAPAGGQGLSDFHLDYTKPASYVIGGITVTGTKFLDQHVLINLSGLVVGDSIEVPGEKISSAIRNLWKQGLFADASIAVSQLKGDQIFLEIQLSERPRLSKFSLRA
jgi:hypothetical protein